MGLIEKIKLTLKIIISKPKSVLKAFSYLFKYGIVGFRQNLRSRATAERFSTISEVEQYNVKMSILMPVYNVEIKWLQKAIDSVLAQTFGNWELCIVDDCSTDVRVKEYLESINHEKIKIKFLAQNSGISYATNEAAHMAIGEYILLMDNDDVIKPNALECFNHEILTTYPDILYSDQDIIDEEDHVKDPFLKPDWSPDLLLSQMYIGHLLGFKKELYFEVGGLRSEFNGSQDYDLMLRMSLKTDKIKHIPHILYSWRALPSSTAANPQSKPYAQTAGLRAIQEYLNQRYGEGYATAAETDNLFVYDVIYQVRDTKKASIIIPTKDKVNLLKTVITSILCKTSYTNYEIIILNNNSEEIETFEYFDHIQEFYSNITVIDAFFEFNWSKLNNVGIRQASGDVYIFLNNDIEIISPDWLNRLMSIALRKDVGAVGPLLLYEDDTIQHAGVVVGMGGWADHVYKGCKAAHYGSPFISPLVARNVSAVTGACMAISRQTIEKIGLFDERFLICGSDIEICLRALDNGLSNVYTPAIRLYHLESKSRSSYIPEIDFKLSYQMYEKYRQHGDSFYHKSLKGCSCRPELIDEIAEIYPLVQQVAIEPITTIPDIDTNIAEITPYSFKKVQYPKKRLNLLVPSINVEHVFGGISTALKFYKLLLEESGFDSRIIITDAAPSKEAVNSYPDYTLVDSEDNCDNKRQIVPYANRYGKCLSVSENDYFMFTGWWTAHCTQEAYYAFGKQYGIHPNRFIYFIQDYEPGFYSWSSRYLLADATYRCKYEQIAVFNSYLLRDFFKNNDYQFASEHAFEPTLNTKLYELLQKVGSHIHKKKQILVYGRPGTERNAFNLIVASLRKWIQIQKDIEDWDILSAGEYHNPIDLGNSKMLISLGKLSLEEYAKTMTSTYAGISLMVSPHPSYPPLEMSIFGIKVITNTYANKDLSTFNENMISLSDASPLNIAVHLNEICNEFKSESVFTIHNEGYCLNDDVFAFIPNVIDELTN